MDRREFLGHMASLPVIGSSLSSAAGLTASWSNDELPGPFSTLRIVNLGCMAAETGMNSEQLLRRIATEIASRTGQQQSADEWATRSIILHRLGLKWWRDGLAVVANLQPINQPVMFTRPEGIGTATTWWMFQLPHEIRDDGNDHLAHVVLVPFFPQGRTQEQEYRCWELIDRMLRQIHCGDESCGTAFWKGLARVDANEARHALNRLSQMVA